jgi:hypothetical protein
MLRSFAAFPRALVRPDLAFAGQEAHRLPKLLLVFVLFLVYVTGERLVQGYYQNAHAKTLSILETEARMGGLMQNAPSQVQAQVRGQVLDSVLGARSGLLTSVSIAASGVGFLLVLLELWLVSTVASQFFGGQEERRGKDRASWPLFLVAFAPLAIRKLLGGILLALRNPDVAANALTLTDYRRLSEIRFDLFSLLAGTAANGLPAFLAAMARSLSDPFFLWTFAILCYGGREVYRVPLRSAVLLSLVLVVTLSLQTALFVKAGLAWEI